MGQRFDVGYLPREAAMAGAGKRLIQALFVILSATAVQAASPPLIVHEWGTFTSYVDMRGRTISGINVDDEPVPEFVHRIKDLPIFNASSRPARWSQGAPRCHHDVTMRLETPVLYFYPPADWQPKPFDVRATFVGGWLTEFYPDARAEGIATREGRLADDIDADSRSSLLWHQLRLDAQAARSMPTTTAPVWLAPRKVAATAVTTSDGKEAEKYLFYRGVGHKDAPLFVEQQGALIGITLRKGAGQLRELPRVWLVEVSPQGNLRYRTARSRDGRIVIPQFPEAYSATSSVDALKVELADALMAEGLNEDEAQAMLETWRLSYFESPGLRVFFTLPQSWTDTHLPIEISTPAQLTRVMVGRIEMVSAHQGATLQRLYALPDESFPTVPLYFEDHSVLKGGAMPLSEMYRSVGREPPQSLMLYESLGRFRDALLAHEWQASEDPARRARLQKIIGAYSACASELR